MNDPTITSAVTTASVTNRQRFSADIALRIAAMLDIRAIDFVEGSPVPFGWHFPLLAAHTPRTTLRSDGFPGLGIAFPDVAGKRLVAAGRRVEAPAQICFGQEVDRTSRIASVQAKEVLHGSMTIVTIEHSINDISTSQTILAESQTYIVLDTTYGAPELEPSPRNDSAIINMVQPDETMLFQFSALSFNSHKIHLDRDYAKMVEGYPDLVVNGGLTTLLMTEILRAEFGERVCRFAVRNSAPLFANRPIQFALDLNNGRKRVLAYDDNMRLAAEMEFETDDL